jgi:hypothetical protein
MNDLQNLVDRVYKQKIDEAMHKGVRAAAFSIYRNLIGFTPVGNPDLWKTKYPPKGYVGGRARANWNISLNTIDATTTENTQAPDETKALEIAARFKIGNTLYISNHLQYIQRLNDGWSMQAPANFVEKAISTGKRQAKELMK